MRQDRHEAKFSSSDNSSSHRQRSRSREKRPNNYGDTLYFVKGNVNTHKHYYYIPTTQQSIGVWHAAQNMMLMLAKQPALTLILCKDMKDIQWMVKSYRLHRKLMILYEEDKTPFSRVLREEKAEVIVTTTRKWSMLYAVEDENCYGLFTLIVNVDFSNDPDYYEKLTKLLPKNGGHMVSVVDSERELERLEKKLAINPQPAPFSLQQEQINREIVATVQFAPPPNPETVKLMKMLPFSTEELSARLFQIIQKQFHFNKSKHLQLPGYVTYQIITDVEFISIKYIWNFLRDHLDDDQCKQIKGMTKFANEKGTVFDVPEALTPSLETMIKKHKQMRKKDKRFDISQVAVLPPLENTKNKEYKALEEKKEYALKHKKDLEVFIGGLPVHADENDIRGFFEKKQVKLLIVRILRDSIGTSKGICFGLCQNKEIVRKALELDGIQFGEKSIRISLAEKKDRK